jgi:hypothetical protein
VYSAPCQYLIADVACGKSIVAIKSCDPHFVEFSPWAAYTRMVQLPPIWTFAPLCAFKPNYFKDGNSCALSFLLVSV